MRWLLLGLLISVVALLVVAALAVRHIRRQRDAPTEKTVENDLDAAIAVPEIADPGHAASRESGHASSNGAKGDE